MFTCFTLQFEINKCQHFVSTYVVVQLTRERIKLEKPIVIEFVHCKRKGRCLGTLQK